MQASAGLVAGSHNRNELVVIIRPDADSSAPKPLPQTSPHICQICGDQVGFAAAAQELFVACNECAFPICRTCYDYERREGTQLCPQCKTRFKRLKGCPRVPGDEEEDDIDDVDNEFSQHQHSLPDDAPLHHQASGAVCRPSYGSSYELNMPPHSVNLTTLSQVPLLTNGYMVDDIPPEQHALVPSFMGGGAGKRIHPLPFSDHSVPVQSRSMDPSKDLAAYGYGSVAWKERMDSWKHKQDKLQMMRNENGSKDWDNDGDGLDLPLMDEARLPLSRKMPISSSQINPYRMIIIIRLVVLGFFFHYRACV